MTTRIDDEEDSKGKKAQEVIKFILDRGIQGFGPVAGAVQVAEEALIGRKGDTEAAIQAIIASHMRWVGASGFVTGLGGLATSMLLMPADITIFYTRAVRMVAAIAHLRGYDVRSDEVRSVIAVTLLGSAGVEILSKAGVEIGKKFALAGLRKLPGKALIEINKRVGFRLLTKFGTKGAVNLVKGVPAVGGVVGGSVNVVSLKVIARYAKQNFPALGQ